MKPSNFRRADIDALNRRRRDGRVYTANLAEGGVAILGPGGFSCVRLEDDEDIDGFTVWTRYDPYAIRGQPRVLARLLSFNEAIAKCAKGARR